MEYFTKNINSSVEKITDIYGEFETGLFYFWVKKGYTFGGYSRSNPFNIYMYCNICIKELKVPILKKKAFSPEYFMHNNIMDTLKYLSYNSNYDVGLILSNIKRLYNLTITKQEIEAFNPDKEHTVRIKYDVVKISDKVIKNIILVGKKIYIYGLGVFAGRNSKVINICHGKIEGYIVSDNQNNIPKSKNGIKVYKVSEIDSIVNIVVIVGLNKEYAEEVAPHLKKFKEVIFLW